MPMMFRPKVAAPANATDEQKKQTNAENSKTAADNLLNQLPAEATGLYLTCFGLLKDQPTLAWWLWPVMIVAAVIMLMYRVGAHASKGVIISSLVSYVLWVYAIGSGPFQWVLAHFGVTDVPLIGTICIVIWTALVKAASDNGYIQ